jgi:exodeoxyribonuclease-3
MSRLPLRDAVKNIVGFEDEHSRAAVGDAGHAAGSELRLVNGYFVNGQAPGTEKFTTRCRGCAGCASMCASELAQHPRLVLVGDFNIAPEDRDSYDPEGLRETIHHTTEERDHFRSCWSWGWSTASGCSSSRRRASAGGTTGCWATRRTAACDRPRPGERGAEGEVKGCAIDRVPRKWKQPSDHAPVTVEL